MTNESERDPIVNPLSQFQYLRVDLIEGTSVRRIKEAKALWRAAGSAREKLELLSLLCERFLRAFLVLDPIDEDIRKELLALGDVQQSGPALCFSSERILNLSARLYRGNWILFFDAGIANPVIPSEVSTDPEALQNVLSLACAGAMIVSEPDDSDWLLVLP